MAPRPQADPNNAAHGRDAPRLAWLACAALLYLGLAVYQLGLPGLHYDEAKEAGVNAMELLRGMPVTAFRGVTLDVAGLQLPLMVQDYIGAFNVYLALPFLALTGVGVPNLRFLPVLTGLAALLLLERAVSGWLYFHASAHTPGEPRDQRGGHAPIAWGGLAAVTLLAASPSFVFWSRQGIFVTNLTQPFCLLMLWQGVRWMRTGHGRALNLAALAAGLALYAKLLAVWVVAPFILLLAGWRFRRRGKAAPAAPPLSWRTVIVAAAAFVIPLLPVVLFNVRSGGTLASLAGNAGRSYYGVDNLAVLGNLAVRLEQLAQTLRGDQFWYLGGSYGNPIALWLTLAAVVAGAWLAPRVTLPPLALLAASVSLSVFTVSDLFVTHYALLHALVVAVVAIALDAVWRAVSGRRWLRAAPVLALILWAALDLSASLRYHNALARSGGLGDHSDASYHLAYFLRYNGMGAPIALDWGIDAPVRFLSQGAVTPIELFSYASLDQPDADFAAQIGQFLPNPDNVYLFHAPGRTVFAGRREVFMAEVEARGLVASPIEQFAQRDGEAVFEVWRVTP